MHTRDGIRLDADIYYPQGEGEFPVLLMRQPYGRAIASTVVYAHPRWYAAQGYIVVIQDVRGRGTSEGVFDLFTHEIEDGFDTINWVSQLPGSTGEVGMYGFSYQGMTQLYAAAAFPEALKVICPAMVAYDLYRDWAYEGGAFCLQGNLGWAIQLAAETARLQGNEAAFIQLYRAARNLPLTEAIPASPQILKDLAPDSFYHDWLNHSLPGAYWEQFSLQPLLSEVDLPMLHIGGWFDPYLRGTLNLYQAMVSQTTSPQNLIIGPWAHLPWGRKVGEIDYGINATSPVDELQIRWFDQFLKGKDTGILSESPVCLWEMGSNGWGYFEEFPHSNQKNYYLISNGLASIREDGGELTSQIPQSIPHTQDILVHDPWRPVPALGGHVTSPAGSFERSSIDCRSDVLTYTSSPLETDLYLVGELTVELNCTADAPSFDLCAILSQVYPDGSVYNFSQGYRRIDTVELPIKINLQATCICILQGNCLRLSLSGACFPAYPVNPGTGSLANQARLMEAKVITITVSCGGKHPSQLLVNQ